MKIIFSDLSTGNKIGIYHDPINVVIKPKNQKVMIIDGKQVISYKYYLHTINEVYENESDVLEYFVEIRVDSASKTITEAVI